MISNEGAGNWSAGILREGNLPGYSDSRTAFCLTDAFEGASLLREGSVHTIVTSPPYFSLRSYLPSGHPSKHLEIGGEEDLGEYVSNLVAVFDALAPALREDGTLWVVIGDTYGRGKRGRYSGDAARGANKRPGAWAQEGYGKSPEAPEKQLLGVPWRFAFAMQDSGWVLRSAIVWEKGNALPQPVRDRPANSYEHVFLFSRRLRYYYDSETVREAPASYSRRGGNATYTANGSASHGVGSSSLHQMSETGRNLRDVWRINPRAYSGSHYAPYPPELVFPCVRASTSEKGVCPVCGTPWRRITEVERSTRKSGGASPKRASLNTGGVMTSGLVNNSLPESRTTGWEPSCGCDAGDREPAIVLDPFCGSGTTLEAARRLGRRSLGFDIDGESLDHLQRRLGYQETLF